MAFLKRLEQPSSPGELGMMPCVVLRPSGWPSDKAAVEMAIYSLLGGAELKVYVSGGVEDSGQDALVALGWTGWLLIDGILVYGSEHEVSGGAGLTCQLRRSIFVVVDPGTGWKDLAVLLTLQHQEKVAADPSTVQFEPGRCENQVWTIQFCKLRKDGFGSSHCSCNVPSPIVVDPLSSSGNSSTVRIMYSAVVKVVAKDVIFTVRLVVNLLGNRVVSWYVASKFWVCSNKGCIDAPTVQVFETSDQVI